MGGEGDTPIPYRYPTRVSALEEDTGNITARLAVVEEQIAMLARSIDERVRTMDKATALALTATEKTTAIAQQTADRAVAKAEASAGKEYLESQIEGLRASVIAQIVAQKEAINAALTAAKEALTAALASSEKAIHKQELAIHDRFASVNEFRAQLADQSKMFVTKSEADLRFLTVEKKLDEIGLWRRTVEAALTAAQSKSGLIYAILAMAIAAGGLLIAVFNLFSKAPVP